MLFDLKYILSVGSVVCDKVPSVTFVFDALFLPGEPVLIFQGY
jgi:hypothetical protein